MNWADISKTIATIAPAVGTALGGPGGAMVGALVANSLGVRNAPEAVAAAIEADPDAHRTIAELQTDPAMIEALTELAKVQTADVQDARQVHKDSKVPAVIAIGFVLIFAVTMLLPIVGAMMGLNIQAVSDRDAGLLGNVLMLIVGFYFGSNVASARKTELIAGEKK